MKDIPFFTSEYGAASLTLKEIPARGIAYVKILSSLQPESLIEECISFCRACGADDIYASGDACLQKYPLTAELIRMTGNREDIPETDASVFPVTEQTVSRWREIYNERMSGVPNAAWMSKRDEKDLLAGGDCYFVHRSGELLGIGKASGNQIDMIASVRKGAGRDVLQAMVSVLAEDSVSLIVAKENSRAVCLYESMGFVPVESVSKWYKIFEGVQEKYLTDRVPYAIMPQVSRDLP